MKTYQYTDESCKVVFVVDGDGVIRTSMLASEVNEGINILPFIKNREQIIQECIDKTQYRLDEFARTRNYDNILSLCTYSTDTNPKFSIEGQLGIKLRSSTWAKLYDILAEVESGKRPLPSSYHDIEPELPLLNWI